MKYWNLFFKYAITLVLNCHTWNISQIYLLYSIFYVNNRRNRYLRLTYTHISPVWGRKKMRFECWWRKWIQKLWFNFHWPSNLLSTSPLQSFASCPCLNYQWPLPSLSAFLENQATRGGNGGSANNGGRGGGGGSGSPVGPSPRSSDPNARPNPIDRSTAPQRRRWPRKSTFLAKKDVSCLRMMYSLSPPLLIFTCEWRQGLSHWS